MATMKQVINKIEEVIVRGLPQLKDLDNITVTKQHTKTLGMYLSDDTVDELLQHVTKSDFGEKLRDGFEKRMIEEKLQWDDAIDFEVGDDLETITQPNEVCIHIKFQSDIQPEFVFVNSKGNTWKSHTDNTLDKALILSSAINNFHQVQVFSKDVIKLAEKHGVEYTLELSKIALNLQSSDMHNLKSVEEFLDTVEKLEYKL